MRGVILALACVALLPACGDAPVRDPADFGAVHYAERNETSINDRCPVRHDPLNDQVPPLYVNGRPLGFC